MITFYWKVVGETLMTVPDTNENENGYTGEYKEIEYLDAHFRVKRFNSRFPTQIVIAMQGKITPLAVYTDSHGCPVKVC